MMEEEDESGKVQLCTLPPVPLWDPEIKETALLPKLWWNRRKIEQNILCLTLGEGVMRSPSPDEYDLVLLGCLSQECQLL